MSSTTSRLVLTLIDLAISGLVRMAPEFSKTSLERFLILRIETIESFLGWIVEAIFLQKKQASPIKSAPNIADNSSSFTLFKNLSQVEKKKFLGYHHFSSK